jgi:hypothetical protein
MDNDPRARAAATLLEQAASLAREGAFAEAAMLARSAQELLVMPESEGKVVTLARRTEQGGAA